MTDITIIHNRNILFPPKNINEINISSFIHLLSTRHGQGVLEPIPATMGHNQDGMSDVASSTRTYSPGDLVVQMILAGSLLTARKLTWHWENM